MSQQGRGREIAAARSVRRGKQHLMFGLEALNSPATPHQTLETLAGDRRHSASAPREREGYSYLDAVCAAGANISGESGETAALIQGLQAGSSPAVIRADIARSTGVKVPISKLSRLHATWTRRARITDETILLASRQFVRSPSLESMRALRAVLVFLAAEHRTFVWQLSKAFQGGFTNGRVARPRGKLFVLAAGKSLGKTQEEILQALLWCADRVRPRPGLVRRRLMVLDAWRALRGLPEWTPEMVAAVEGSIQ